VEEGKARTLRFLTAGANEKTLISEKAKKGKLGKGKSGYFCRKQRKPTRFDNRMKEPYSILG